MNKPESLFDLSAQYRRLLDTAASPEAHEPGGECEDGEVTDEFCAALERIEGALADKVDGYGYVRAGLLHRAEEATRRTGYRRRARLDVVEQLENGSATGRWAWAIEGRWTAIAEAGACGSPTTPRLPTGRCPSPRSPSRTRSKSRRRSRRASRCRGRDWWMVCRR